MEFKRTFQHQMTTIYCLARIITVAYVLVSHESSLAWIILSTQPPFFSLTIHLVPVKENVAIALSEMYYFSKIYIKWTYLSRQ